MQITPVAPDDPAALRAYVSLANAGRRLDAPWLHPLTEHQAGALLRWGWDLEPAEACLLRDGGEPVALGEYATTRHDNQHLAWLEVEVHPEHRRRGAGSAVLEALVARARAEGRTSVGISGWDAPGPRAFVARHGFEERSREVLRRQHPGEVDRAALGRLYDGARPRAAAYELVRLAGPVPAEDLAAYTTMVAAINDAPRDELDVEDEVFTPERLRCYERAQAAAGGTLLRVFARHRASGELAGHTAVVVDGERPQLAEQHDTSVVAAHRGHRLGLLLKLELLRWLAEAQPQVVAVDTWNAESNDHMIALNHALRYRVLGRAVSFQREV